MSNTQWTTGLCDVVNGSQIVIGTASCDWQNQISANDIFKVNLDGESVYNIGAVSSASKIILSANYTGSTNTGLSYIVGRNFSINRGYYRLSQGDYDFAEILSQDTIDPIDEDINTLFGAYITGSAIGTLASSFAINMDATLCRFWTDNLTSSRNFRLPDQSATLVGLGVEQEFSADQTFNASVWIKGNASIDGALNLDSLNIQTLNASDLNATTGDIDTLHSTTLTVNSLTATTGDVDTLHSAILTANNLNATTGDIETLHSTNFTASEIIASSMKVSDLTNNRIVIAGTSGELEDDANLTWDGSLLTVTGNLTVTGSAVIVTASNLSVKDPLIVLAKDQSGAAAFDAGLIVERGSSQNVGMFWDESADKWVMAYTDETGMTAGNVIIASYGDLRVWDFQAEDLSASNINASAGDISTLHSATFTANDVNATTGDIDTFHSLTFTANNLDASTGDANTLHSSVFTASNLTASRLILIGEVQSDLLQTKDVLTDFVVSGLLPATSAGLTSNISTGQAYVMGKRIVKANTTAHTYTANRDTYVDISKSALFTFSGVLNASSAPSIAASSIRLAKSVTNATAIISVTDLRELDFTIGTSSRDININRLHTATLIANDINATTGDILTLTASNLDASTGDINTLHSGTLTVNDLNATTGDIETLHSLIFTASNVNASTGNIHTLHTNTLTASTYTAMTRANASIDAIQSNITNINASIAQNASDIVVANASIDALQADKISKTIFNAKGDILTASADDTPSIITVGANNTVLTADSAQIGGLKWSVPAGGGDVAGPATNTDLYIPQWNGVDSKVLKNGFAKSDLVLQPNPILKTANYQILASDNMILASGNITITLASASSKHGIRIGNRSLDANASTLVKKSGGDTIEGNASLNLANKYDTVYLIGDGTNTHFQF